MELKALPEKLTVCRVRSFSPELLDLPLFFAAKTDEEYSLVCPTDLVPPDTEKREDGWRAFRICGVLDFSLVGILAPIADLLAADKIGIFAVSTYNTDYVLVRETDFERALALLSENGYTVL